MFPARDNASSTVRLRARTGGRRSTRSGLAEMILAATVCTVASSEVTSPPEPNPTTSSAPELPLQFMRQTTAMSVSVKRKRQRLLQSFNEPLHTKSLSLGQIMMKRDRLLQQI